MCSCQCHYYKNTQILYQFEHCDDCKICEVVSPLGINKCFAKVKDHPPKHYYINITGRHEF